MKKIIAFALITAALTVGTLDVSLANPDWVIPFSTSSSSSLM
ncbi:hypothetical protein [Alteribacter aurantiacus]|nr:hypothetical protein [Alteribacter aurantiacus]